MKYNALEFDLPVGAIVHIGNATMRHLGNGKFSTPIGPRMVTLVPTERLDKEAGNPGDAVARLAVDAHVNSPLRYRGVSSLRYEDPERPGVELTEHEMIAACEIGPVKFLQHGTGCCC